jgi:small-conductance mechanosensitive channel
VLRLPPSLPGATPLPLAATGGSGGTEGGWLYTLLTKLGLDPSASQTVVDFVFRPLEILLVLAVAALVARYGARLLRRVLTRATGRAAARGDDERGGARVSTVVALIVNLWRLFVAVVALAIVLGILGIDLTPILASATVIGATIGFGAQSLVRDYLSGMLLIIEDQYGIGDTITVANASGVVEDLSLRVTRLRAADGSVWYVPNGEIRQLTNASRGWAKAVVDLAVAPGDAGALDRVREAAAGAAREVAATAPFAATSTEPPEVVGMVAAAGGTCTVRVALRTVPARRAALERALREAAVARLAAEGLLPDGA